MGSTEKQESAEFRRGDLLGCLLEESSSEEEDFCVTVQVCPGLSVTLQTPEDDRVPSTLFASNVWNGAKIIAEYIASHPQIVKDKRVVEFGAG